MKNHYQTRQAFLMNFSLCTYIENNRIWMSTLWPTSTFTVSCVQIWIAVKLHEKSTGWRGWGCPFVFNANLTPLPSTSPSAVFVAFHFKIHPDAFIKSPFIKWKINCVIPPPPCDCCAIVTVTCVILFCPPTACFSFTSDSRPVKWHSSFLPCLIFFFARMQVYIFARLICF